MSTCFQSFSDGGAESVKSFASLDDLDANDLHGSDSSEEERATSGSENAIVLNLDARIMQIGKENDLEFSSGKIRGGDKGGPVLREHWKPEGCLRVGRSRSGFPDCLEDHLVQLLVCKNQHTREALDITDKYDITVAVSYDRAGESSLKMPDYQCKRIKSVNDTSRSMIGVIGYLFRFHEPDTKYKISFYLNVIPPKERGKKKSADRQTAPACQTISEISVTLETGARASSKSGKTTAIVLSPSYALNPAPLSKESVELYRRSLWVIKKLQSCLQDAKWSDCYKYASDLSLAFPDTDTQIAIKLQVSVGACYQNELDRALQLSDEAISMIPKAKNRQLLVARGYGYRAGILRKQGSIGMAEKCVQLAEQNISACQTSLETSFIAYERASVLNAFIGRTPQRSLTQVNEAVRNLEKCIDVCQSMEAKDSHLSDLSAMQHHFVFVLIKMTLLLLDCSTETARQRIISEEFIAKGKAVIDKLENKCWSEMAQGDKILLFLARSDLEYRQNNFKEAEKFASLAKDMAVEVGYNMAISNAKERLDHLREFTCHDEIYIKTSPTSESEGVYGDVTSTGSESDWLRETLK